ncbi:MAG: HAD hydrolase family protein [Lachnospiraceae bacterium]|nr:HAD hydrolase family protein [Lachnospiraceae bacterium]
MILMERSGTIPIGDSNNDLEMLQTVPNAVAMGQCSPDILPFCDYQTSEWKTGSKKR